MTFEEAVNTIAPGRYRHFKGNEYEVIGIAKHSEDESPMVVYKALYGDGGLWCRPAEMWNEMITRDGKTFRRFEKRGNCIVQPTLSKTENLMSQTENPMSQTENLMS